MKRIAHTEIAWCIIYWHPFYRIKKKIQQIKININFVNLCLQWAPSSLHGQDLLRGHFLLGLLGEREKKIKLPRRGKENIAIYKVCVALDRFDKDISYQFKVEH